MSGFTILEEQLISLDEIENTELSEFVAYWRLKAQGRAFALRKDIDPVEIPTLLGSIRIVAIEGNGLFRFRLYGTNATNPDGADMTNKTTKDYDDKDFGDFVARHYAAVAADGQGRCWHIKAEVDEGAYEYIRVVLPISYNGETVDGLIVKSTRIKNEALLWRR